jgi:hypothetical protein
MPSATNIPTIRKRRLIMNSLWMTLDIISLDSRLLARDKPFDSLRSLRASALSSSLAGGTTTWKTMN